MFLLAWDPVFTGITSLQALGRMIKLQYKENSVGIKSNYIPEIETT